MEPKALLNLDGNLVPSLTPAKPAAAAELSPTKEFLNLSSSASSSRSSIRHSTSATPLITPTVSCIPEDESTPKAPTAAAADESSLLMFTTPTPAAPLATTSAVFATPSATIDGSDGAAEGEGMPLSPTTPYYMAQGSKLIQQTCPPKQNTARLFSMSGEIEDQEDEKVRKKLMAARRKSLQWAPRVRSPLGKRIE